jgi:hypothetical protein
VNIAHAHYARPAYDQRKWLLGKIHDVAKRLGMDEQTRRDFMMELVGENSCRDMTHLQLKKVLWALTHKTPRSPDRPTGGAMTPIGDVVRKTTDYILKKSAVGSGGGPAGRAPSRSGRDERLPDEISTIEQTQMIEHLFADIELMNPGRLPRTWRTGFCKRQCGRVWPQTRAQANKIIEALKSMRDRGWKPKEKEAALP